MGIPTWLFWKSWGCWNTEATAIQFLPSLSVLVGNLRLMVPTAARGDNAKQLALALCGRLQTLCKCECL